MVLSSNLRNSIIIVLLGLSAAFVTHVKYSEDILQLKNDYSKELGFETARVADDINDSMLMLYQGLRTIARMSGVRGIGHTESSLDNTTRQSIQEIYNNLATNIDLSEVYIVPHGFDPDQIDSHTGKLFVPIVTFDDLIVGRSADANVVEKADMPAGLEEIEIYEYRLMKEQLEELAAIVPNESDIDRLNYPAITGKEVITCDNRNYSKENPNDGDRSGLVYSVPFYGEDGKLKGVVAGVLLTSVIRKLLPNSHQVLHNNKYNYIINPFNPGAWVESDKWIKSVRANPNLIYSESIPLEIIDINKEWHIWAGVSNQDFWALESVRANQAFFSSTYLIIGLFSIGLIIYLRMQEGSRQLVLQKNNELEHRVLVRTRELEEQKKKLEITNDRLVEATGHKSDFMARMSHELRTPLNAIIGYSEILREEAEEVGNTTAGLDLGKIYDAGKHLLTLINGILDISKIEAGRMELYPEMVDIRSLIQDIAHTISPLMEKQHNHLSLAVPIDIGELHTDMLKLRQILLNLLSNACKFTDAGNIFLEVTRVEKDGKEYVLFCIKDNGIGISDEQMKKLFQDFTQADVSTTREYGGTGLGLAISKRFTDMMGGDISVKSRLGEGSTFYVMLPLRSE